MQAKRAFTLPLAGALASVFLLAACGQQQSEGPSDGGNQQASVQGERDQIRIVGSSTVYPFSSYVAEEYGATTDAPTPVVESTGSGGGMKLFCTGTALDTPDITNASRQMKKSEFENCQSNGVADIVEITIGADGIVVGYQKGQPQWALTREQLTLAVADQVPKNGKLVSNPYQNWRDIDESLPDKEILVYGPPSSSGTRDAFETLVMEHASKNIEGFGGEYTRIRQDGKYVPSGENDNLIVQKLAQNGDAIGIFGYSFLEENRNKLDAATIDGVAPKRPLISSGEYPVSRSLFFYVKLAHLDPVPTIPGYVNLFLAEKMIGQRGLLTDLGLIPLPEKRRAEVRKHWETRDRLEKADLED